MTLNVSSPIKYVLGVGEENKGGREGVRNEKRERTGGGEIKRREHE